MYKLLIVDDEPMIVQRLMSSIDWNKLSVSELYSAYNGKEALEIIHRIKPQLIVSDVCMPYPDGLFLAQTIYESGMNAQMILISDNSDFHYVKQALNYGCAGYIAKPVDEDELIKTVQKGIDSINQKQQFIHALPYAQERFWENAINSYYTQSKNFQSESQNLGLFYNPEWSYFCTCMKIHFSTNVDNYKQSLLTSSIVFAFSNYFSKIGTERFFFAPSTGEVAGIIFCDSTIVPSNSIDRHMEEIVATIESFDGCFASYGLSENYSGTSQIPVAYQSARKNADTMVHPPNRSKAVVYYSQYSQAFYMDNSFIDNLCDNIIAKNSANIETIIQNYLFQIPECSYESVFRLYGFEIITLVSKQLVTRGYFHDMNNSEFTHTLMTQLQDVIDKNSLKIFLLRIIQIMISDINMDSEIHANHVLKDILRYVEKHYAEPISSKSVAEHFFFNPSYFSRFFNAKMNIRFSTYLTNYRIQKAEELMQNTNMRTADIAISVGFTDVHYFYKTYKRLRGITPRQFRH